MARVNEAGHNSDILKGNSRSGAETTAWHLEAHIRMLIMAATELAPAFIHSAHWR